MTATGTPRINLILRFLLSLSAAIYIIGSVPLLVLAGLLLAHAETDPGRLFALAVMAGLPAPILFWFASWLRQKRRILVTGAACAGLSLLLLGADYALTPDGRPLPGSPAQSCFTGATAYRRASMANLVPEMRDRPTSSSSRSESRCWTGLATGWPQTEDAARSLTEP